MLSPQMLMRPFRIEDLDAILRFTDRGIGAGYYSRKELEEIFERSSRDGVMCSYLLQAPNGEIKGVRITYPPTKWTHGKGKGLHPEKWPHRLQDTAYFQSLFLDDDVQGQGWGGKLSQESIQALKKVSAKGIVCHSWKESPNGSSSRYLVKMGFELIAEHPLYWKDVDYRCTRCGDPPCQCTAQEMYLNLERKA